MNKFLAVVALSLATMMAVDAADMFGHGGFDDDFGFGPSLFRNNQNKQGDRFFVSSANRLGDRFGKKFADRDRAAIAAQNKRGDRVAANNRFAEEDYVNKKNVDEVAFKHDQSNKSNFQLQLTDQKAFDESTDFKARSGNQFNKGSRTAKDNKFAAEHQDSAAIKAAADRDSKFAADKDFKSEDLFKKQGESFFANHDEFGHGIF